jgi:single-strand DNA-binding protein
MPDPMAKINRAMVGGNLVHTPRLEVVPGDRGPRVRAVFRLALADPAPWGERAFIEVLVTGRQAELVGQYLVKGSACVVEGKLQDHWWTPTPGKRIRRLVLVARTVEFLR